MCPQNVTSGVQTKKISARSASSAVFVLHSQNGGVARDCDGVNLVEYPY